MKKTTNSEIKMDAKDKTIAECARLIAEEFAANSGKKTLVVFIELGIAFD